MRVSVIIPTTDGPARLLRLAPLLNAPRSVMRTQDDYRPLPVSAAYQAFSAPGGPMDMAFGLAASAFDLRLSARIDSGRSWELPVALAHWLQAQGHELGTGAPELVVWATGALDLDMGVIAQDYHLAEKLACSRDMLNAAAAEGQQVVAFLPGAAAPPEGLSGAVTLHEITRFAQATSALGPFLGRDKWQAAAPASQAPRGRRPYRAAVGLLGVAGLAMAAALAFSGAWDWRPQPPATGNAAPAAGNEAAETDGSAPDDPQAATASADEKETGATAEPAAEPPTEPAAEIAPPVLPVLLLMRPGSGANCIDVHFGGAEKRRESLAATAGGFEEASLERLCAIGLQLPEQAEAALSVQLPEPLLAHVTRSDREAELTLAPGEERRFRLIAHLPDRLDLRWLVTDAHGETHALEHSLARDY